jgi:hypothetical protein
VRKPKDVPKKQRKKHNAAEGQVNVALAKVKVTFPEGSFRSRSRGRGNAEQAQDKQRMPKQKEMHEPIRGELLKQAALDGATDVMLLPLGGRRSHGCSRAMEFPNLKTFPRNVAYRLSRFRADFAKLASRIRLVVVSYPKGWS